MLTSSGKTLTDESYYDDEETSLEYKLDIKVAHLDKERYLEDLYFDKGIIETLRKQAQTILSGGRDEKLIELNRIVHDKIKNTPTNPGNRKILIFSAFADTADYIYDSISQ